MNQVVTQLAISISNHCQDNCHFYFTDSFLWEMFFEGNHHCLIAVEYRVHESGEILKITNDTLFVALSRLRIFNGD